MSDADVSDLECDDTPSRIIALAGGIQNIASVTRCWSRLRLVLHDYTAADDQALDRMPEVHMAVWQGKELHLVLRSGLELTYRAVQRAMALAPIDEPLLDGAGGVEDLAGAVGAADVEPAGDEPTGGVLPRPAGEPQGMKATPDGVVP